jgi:predicted transposase YbfD/YdcC
MNQTKVALTPRDEKDSTGDEEQLLLFDVGSLQERFHQVKDQRKARGIRYPLPAMLALLLLGKLCGCDTPAQLADWAIYRAEELMTLLKLKRASMPVATTISRVLKKAIAVTSLERLIRELLEEKPGIRQADHMCLDGKQIRGTSLAGEGNVYLLGLYVPAVGVMLYQVELEAGEGELSVAPELLKAVDLRKKMVTGDAGFTQRNLSIQIVRQGGDYLWKVKRNQPQLHDLIEQTFAIPEAARTAKTAVQRSASHGRIETRIIMTSSMLKGLADWPHLSQVIKVTCKSVNKKTGHKTVTTQYGVTSRDAKDASPAKLLAFMRSHWQIESGSHFCRDVTFHEDFCDLRRGTAAHVMAIFNNLATAIIRFAGFTNIASARRFFAANPALARDTIVRRL